MSKAIELYKDGGFYVIQRTAMAMSKSGYFPDAKSEAQAIVKVMAGAELGISPFAAMTGIHIIQGKPTMGATLLAGIVKNDPRYDYRVTKLDDGQAIIQFYENGEKSGVSSFSAADAKRAGTKNMDKFPRNMLFARAMSNGFKWYCAGAGGGMAVYSDGEIVQTSTPPSGESVDFETGEIVRTADFTNPAPDRDDFVDYEADEPPFVPDTFGEPPAQNTTVRDVVTIYTDFIASSAGNDGKPTEKMLAKCQKDLRTTCGGKGADASAFLKSLFNVDSSKELTYGHVKTLLNWMGSTHDNDWTISPVAIEEAQIVLLNE